MLLQVNVDDDPAKAGFAPDALPEALERIAALDALEVRGLMTIGRLVDERGGGPPDVRDPARPVASACAPAAGRSGPDLSMGMTDDFEVAIEEGATIVRVGRAIFGERPHHHGPGPPTMVRARSTTPTDPALRTRPRAGPTRGVDAIVR